MENKEIAQTLRLLSQLMELHQENPFKIKSVANAAFQIDKLPFSISNKRLNEIDQIAGLGKSIATKVLELVQTKHLKELDELIKKTPEGIIEMLQIKGIGPKKIYTIWKDLAIENCGELYYACNENRLIEAKGFGLKTQETIKKAIEFRIANSGYFLYAKIEPFAEALIIKLQEVWPKASVFLVGDYRRRCEIIDSLTILTTNPSSPLVVDQLKNIDLNIITQSDSKLETKSANGLKITIIHCSASQLGWNLILHTGNETHVKNLNQLLTGKTHTGKTEEEIYHLVGLPFIEPELREGLNEITIARRTNKHNLIELKDLQGSLHNHSTWSDGVHTLEEMALFCRDELKLSYLGICDHSKSAFYANGLSEIRVKAQHQEIDALNKKLAPFHIFKGIESDILFDGSLDYADEILQTFDFVVASIHSVLKMDEQKATERLIKAIENPYTTILGHPTGRLLLSRSAYPINHQKVIDACAANQVVIEINANPLRLDLDWRWHQYAIEKGVILSINPDAHRTTGLFDMRYGILVARKGGVSATNCLNTKSLKEISAFFTNRKKIN